jgi:serine protease
MAREQERAVIRSTVIGASVLGLVLSIPAIAAPPAFGSPDPADSADASTIARGLIIHYEPEQEPQRGVRAATRTPRTKVIRFDRDVPLTQAEARAREWRGRPGIASVEPDVLLTAAEQVFPNDPLFDEQWYLWDAAAADGGYSVRAPDVWAATTGAEDVVIAVIDTGVAEHPDLAATVLPGYDFVSDIPMANDGDAWDPNPADPGDWVTAADIASGSFPSSCTRTTNSTWHGTHVAGIAGAMQDNSYGISGAAPGTTILNVRALGKCGGFLSDIAAAVRWSVGDEVIDPTTLQPIPINPRPASVVNLSLGGLAACSTSMRNAVATATARGAVVVAAAGNESRPLSEYVPANCPGVVSVVATDRNGSRASYSNFGTADSGASISAPGGSGIAGITSTDNTGPQGPQQPNFGVKTGTSMAAPIVSAGAGLLYSLGVDDPAEVTDRLLAAVQAFPESGTAPCTQIACGSGILDFGALAESISLTGERGTVRGRPGVLVDGTTIGLPEGTSVTPYVKFPGQTSYTAGTGIRQVSIVSGITGEFGWQRRTGKKIYVYFRAVSGERSPRIIIPAK